MRDLDDIAGLHLAQEILQNLDVGLVVLDAELRVELWNGFMENHSGKRADEVHGRSILEVFPDLPAEWFRHKVASVLMLGNSAFTIWEQRPYLFPFKNYRPITGTADWMYQNTTFIPLRSLTGDSGHLCIIVYDVTDAATSRLQLTAANSELQRLSRVDGLTRLYNRAFWEERVTEEYERQRRTGNNVTLVMFDIDHFKRVNDTHGHQAGDEVIRTLADLVRGNKRGTDIAGRYGGEEFSVVLVDTDIAAARFFAERLRKVVENARVEFDAKHIEFTISIGVAQLDATKQTVEAWIGNADRALYEAKAGGRNRVAYREAP